jgi:hypothetical protein
MSYPKPHASPSCLRASAAPMRARASIMTFICVVTMMVMVMMMVGQA